MDILCVLREIARFPVVVVSIVMDLIQPERLLVAEHFAQVAERSRVEKKLIAIGRAEIKWHAHFRRQLRVPGTMREHLEAAVENDDPAEARRLVARFEFTDAQRRNVGQLLDAWERTLARRGR